MADLRDKRLDLVLQQLEELPTLPAVAVRVLQVTADNASNAEDVVELISSDPALTARILQLVCRADRGVRDEAHTVERAVMLLGFDAVRNAVLAVSVFQSLSGPTVASTPLKFSRQEFWKHCLAVACCCELLAEHSAGAISPSEAFICGLLHDLGKIALDVAIPRSYARVVEAAELLRGDIAELERTVIGVDHLIAGKRLAERWQLPTSVRDAAWLHGSPPEALPAVVHAPLVNLVTLADDIVRRQHLGYSGNYAAAPDRASLLASLNLSERQVDDAATQLVERMEPRLTALGIGEETGESLYRQALAQADRELKRVSSQLAVKSKKLSQRTHVFDAIQQFQAQLRADASPAQALTAIARTAAGVLGTDRIAAFSLTPAQDYAEALLCDADGIVIESALVELPGMADLTGAQDITAEELAALAELGPDESAPPPNTHAADKSPAVSALQSPSMKGSAGGSAAHQPHAAMNAALQQTPGDGPVLPAADTVEWLIGALSAQLRHDRRYWICLSAEGNCVGGLVWGAGSGEADRLTTQAHELSALSHGWSLALRMAQVREEVRTLAEELAEANRRLLSTQDTLLRTRALTTVGEMAAGAAHEMNNPLAVISGRSQLLARTLEDERQKASARQIHEHAQRLSDIITEMMAFAKPEPPSLDLCDVGPLVTAAVSQATSRTEPDDREIDVSLQPVPSVRVDGQQITAALTEIVDNALQATHAKLGKISVQVAHDPWSGQVVIKVTDNGCGMSEVTLKRAFDPFFSSKPAGRRRGLGLAKALRWVECSGGSIRLQSQQGAGAQVLILLPAAQESAAATDHAPAAALAR